jgi:hypothetical protein
MRWNLAGPLSVCQIKRDRESGSTEGAGWYYCPCWLDRGWWRRCLTIGEGRFPSSLYCTSYISTGIFLVVSGAFLWQYLTLLALLVVCAAHLWQYFPLWINLVVSHLSQCLTLWVNLVVFGAPDNISLCWPSWWYLAPTYDNISPFV